MKQCDGINKGEIYDVEKGNDEHSVMTLNVNEWEVEISIQYDQMKNSVMVLCDNMCCNTI